MPDSMTVGTSGAPLKPLFACHGEYSQPTGVVQLQDLARHDGNHRGDLTADHIVGCRPHAAIGNVDNIRRTRLLLEHLSDKMIAGANSRGPIGELAGIGLGVGGQLLQAIDRKRRMNRESKGAGDQAMDGPEIPDGIVGGTCRGQRDHDLGAAIAEQKRIAIGCTLRDHGGSEHAAGASDILDVDRPEQRRHPVGPGPTDLVTCGAGSVRDHQPDRTRWVVVSLGVA